MKKTFTLCAIALFSIITNAQTTIWEDDFNDGDISDWTIVNVDGNPSTWQANNNLTENIDLTGPNAVLATYNYDFETNDFYPTTGIENNFWLRENNWAISPAIDLSGYEGDIQLKINMQTAAYDADNILQIYASTSPEQESFVVLDTITVIRDPWGSVNMQFTDYTVDLSAYAGQAQVYFAITTEIHLNFVGNEVDRVYITTNQLGVTDETKTTVSIKQNPVKDVLTLQWNNRGNENDAMIRIFDVSGKLLTQTSYQDSGLDVSDLSNGIYFVSVSDGRLNQTLKFIKN